MEVTLVVDHSNVESDSDSNSEVSREVQISSEKWPTVAMKTLGFYWILPKWKEIFVTSCVLAVLLDPLFLYIPIINQNVECLRLDESLKIATLVLRSITDVFYILDIIIQIYRYRYKDYSSSILPTIAKTVWQSYILIDILAILPFPQVAILIFFPKMRASRSLNVRKFVMNAFVLMQYVPRVLRIYLLCKEPKKFSGGETAIWVKGVLNFFMYILASHVLGAFWYFFAIQRMTVCWHHACQNENRCDTTTFACHDRRFGNLTFLNNSCPVKLPNTTLFDFGIFLSLLQSGIPESTNYQQKFTNCFWWGLRNLSSLGSNLVPSIDAWENLFAAFISIIGLLLFIYLIGNLQTYMQLDTARIEAYRHKVKVEGKLEKTDQEIELWLSKNGIPKKSIKDIKSKITEIVRRELEVNRDVDVHQNLLSILPLQLHNYIISRMPLTRLKQVPMIQKMHEPVLKAICEHLKPIKYSENDIIIQEDEPLERMLIVVDGLVSIEKINCSGSSQQGEVELYGEELLAWPSTTSFPDILPLATESARAINGDVEALVLLANDMKSVASEFSLQFRKYRKYYKIKELLAGHLGAVETSNCRLFSPKELKNATNNYHESGLIGEGGYGKVYRGILRDKTVVAIKMSKISSQAKSDQFVTEVMILSRINHRNVVRLLGYCIDTKMAWLVFEYIPNGTLRNHIHRENGKGSPPLPLELRIKIAAETAEALAFLHSSTPIIIHRDVKPSNILLDNDYTVKVSDLGISLSRILPGDSTKTHISTVVMGSIGYLDPEYFLRQQLTEKSDVYSFGVVLAELITSRFALSRDRPREEMNLAAFLVRSVEKGRLNQIFDHEIINVNEGNFETAKRVAHLATRCLRDNGEDRPSMRQVAAELEELMAGHIQIKDENFSRSSSITRSWRTEADYILGSPSMTSSFTRVENVNGECDDDDDDYTRPVMMVMRGD